MMINLGVLDLGRLCRITLLHIFVIVGMYIYVIVVMYICECCHIYVSVVIYVSVGKGI